MRLKQQKAFYVWEIKLNFLKSCSTTAAASNSQLPRVTTFNYKFWIAKQLSTLIEFRISMTK